MAMCRPVSHHDNTGGGFSTKRMALAYLYFKKRVFTITFLQFFRNVSWFCWNFD